MFPMYHRVKEFWFLTHIGFQQEMVQDKFGVIIMSSSELRVSTESEGNSKSQRLTKYSIEIIYKILYILPY